MLPEYSVPAHMQEFTSFRSTETSCSCAPDHISVSLRSSEPSGSPGGPVGPSLLPAWEPEALWSPDTVVPVVSDFIPEADEAESLSYGFGSRREMDTDYEIESLSWGFECGTGYSDKTCGNILLTVAACNNHPGTHKPLLIPDSCGRLSCPICWETTAERAGKRARDSLEGYMSLKYGNSQNLLPGMALEYLNLIRARHIVFGCPPSVQVRLILETLQETDAAGFQELLQRKFDKESLAAIKAGGLTAGIMITHDIRLKKDKAARKADLRLSTNRYREVLDYPDWREHVKLSLHAHAIAYGSVVPYDEFTKKTGGWIYRVIRVVDDVEKLMKYLLSHAPAVPHRKTYVPFGEMNSQHMRKVKEYRCREPILCEECLEAGIIPEKAVRVIAMLEDGPDGQPVLKCEYDGDIDARHRSRSRGAPVSWSFERITNQRFTRVKSRWLYERVVPGKSRGPGISRARGSRRRNSGGVIYSELGYAKVNLDRFADRRVWVRPEIWAHLVDSGVISSWYEDVV